MDSQMQWFLVDKSNTVQPQTGSYSNWKALLRSEGHEQCVYCAIHEGSFGGARNFHVEHHRPRKTFPHLTDVISNLFYSCAICNSFKGSDWPSYARLQYPDPSSVNYSTFLSIDESAIVFSAADNGTYLIERLYLNRPHLILLRRFLSALSELRKDLADVELILDTADVSNAALRQATKLSIRAARILSKIPTVVPYNPGDVSRKKKTAAT
jgi:hypothetical protein